MKIFVYDFDKMSWPETLKEQLPGHEIEIFTQENEFFNFIIVHKPQLVFIESTSGKVVRRFMSEYPFIPVIIYGDISDESKYKKLAEIHPARYLSLPFESEALTSLIKEITWKSLAKQEIWDDQMGITLSLNRIFKLKYIGMILALLCSITVSGIVFKNEIFNRERIIPILESVHTPYSNPSGLSIDINNSQSSYSLWICDWQTQNIYEHIVNNTPLSAENNFKIRKIYSFPQIRFSCIAINDNFLWSSDPWNKKIYKHTLDTNLTIISSFTAPGTGIVGLCHDGKYLWSCDNVADKIFKHQIDDKLTVIETYPTPGTDIIGIFVDSENKIIWTVDSGTNKIYKHKYDMNLTVETVYIPNESELSGQKISSITGDKNYIWISIEKLQKVIRYPRKLLEPV